MTKSNPSIHDDILSCIGMTPIVRLNRLTEGLRTQVLAKCEFFNPGASVKDRIGRSIIEDAEERGLIRPGGTIVEATSGNTGVGLALTAAIKGYKSIFTLPDKMSTEKVRLLKAFGAEVIVTPTVPPEHPDYYVTVAKNIVDDTPNSYFANQFYNQVNPETHYRTTGPEIWEQLQGRLDVLVGGMGTGGTISGVGKFLKEKEPSIRVVGADPEGSLFKAFKEGRFDEEGSVYKVEGIGQDKLPETAWLDYVDEFRTVSDKDSFNVARQLARREGLFVGGSSGTATKIALDLACELDDPDKIVLVILTDTGERYLSKFHNDEWMRENRFLDEPASDVRHLLLQKTPAARTLVSCTSTDTLKQSLDLMARHNVSQLPVIDHGESVGSVRESKIMAQVIEKSVQLEDPVATAMDPPFPVVGANESVEYVSRLLGRDNPALLVRVGAELTGILTRFDVIQAMNS